MAEPAEPQTESDRPESHVIQELTADHPDWAEYVEVINGEGQARWAFDAHFESFRRHFVMAKQDGRVVGFLMYVVWDIGPNDRGQRALMVDGRPLTEAKIIAFGVKKEYRRQGIGRALQEHTLRRAKTLGCYQVRSVSDGDHPENHRLKLAMGFAVEPMERDQPTLAFIMPLKATTRSRGSALRGRAVIRSLRTYPRSPV